MKTILIVALLASPALADSFSDTIGAAAKSYRTWKRVDAAPNIAPDLCRQPTPADYGHAAEIRATAATEGPHKDKLYYLAASDKYGYRRLGQKDATALPIGFAIVKESFSAKKASPHPVKATEIDSRWQLGDLPDVTTLKTKDGVLEIDQPKGLFVMAKVGNVEGADHGWIYGTVSPEGKVTSAGKLDKCMGCHVEAKFEDRLFGLKAIK